MDKRQILKLIKYNKLLQNKIEVNLIDYHFFSDRIIIFDTTKKNIEGFHKNEYQFEGKYLRRRKGKEYGLPGKELIFEGEYLNGKRNGKGKEYAKYGEIFEGEYINGKRSGKGKDLYEKIEGEIRVIFEGEYLEGKKWNGIERVYKKKVLKYEVEYLNGERNGKGKEYDIDGNLIFESEYLNGERWNGFRKGYGYDDKLLFEEKYLNGKIIIDSQK